MQFYDFENSIGFIINSVAKAFVRALDSELREHSGVTIGQWKVMVMLVRQNGLTQKEIADRLNLEAPTLIPIIDRMEKDGLLERKADPEDRRINRIYRTDKANALWDGMFNCAMRVRQSSLKAIPENEIQITKNVLERISQNLGVEINAENIPSCAENIMGTSTKMGSLRELTLPTDPRRSAREKKSG